MPSRPFAVVCRTVPIVLAFGIATELQAEDFAAQRRLFVQTEKLLEQGRTAEAEPGLARLQSYPLYPHLLYQRLLLNLRDETAVRTFLNRYGHTRQAELLRSRWLEQLAADNAWGNYLAEYRPTEATAARCLYHYAQSQTGRGEEAWKGARALWLTGAPLPAACDRLIQTWRQSGDLTGELVWQRYTLAMRKDNVTLAPSLDALLPPEQQGWAGLWRQVHSQPRKVLNCSGWDWSSPIAARIFADGVERLASDEPLLAQTVWSLNKSRFPIDPEVLAHVDRRLGLNLATGKYIQATGYLSEFVDTSEDDQTRTWRLRAALFKQDWASVLLAYENLNPDERNQAEWRYWRGRALEAMGDRSGATEEYHKAATEREYYGFLAAERGGLRHALPDRPQEMAATELDRLAATPPFLAAREWRTLERIGEARSEWLHGLKSLPAHDQAVAARLARRWGWDQMAMTSAIKAGLWDDLSLRFPTGFQQAVLPNARSQQLDPALVFGVIRRESAFDPGAGSPVGARGLMQLMPATGELLAQRLKDKPPSAAALLDPQRNVRYGTAYLRDMLERFGNHPALAAAAYNAGPGKVDRWLPALQPMPGDIWVETIPYRETRNYVGAVLTNTLLYRIRLGQSAPRLGAMLGDVAPGPAPNVPPDRTVAVPACE
ncbi:MAG: lytic murein transglycosylase [Methylococcaceae bacterium]|nr:lytic murein transglycosylase [Methylococcaceae bacterium]